MKELCTKGVDELSKLKNRVARLYGMGRISTEDFNKLNAPLMTLEILLKEEVKEVDGE